MLFEYSKILKENKLKIKTILHIGAHKAEEARQYFREKCEQVIWVEANPKLIDYLNSTLNKEKNIVLNATISSEDHKDVELIVTNNTQSSSILELGQHRKLFPSVVENKRIKTKTKTIKTLFSEQNLDFSEIDLINLDIQGAELLAIKGMPKGLSNVKAIITEINTDYVYENCSLIGEMDAFLANIGFERVETVMWQNHPWGDALYVRK